MANTSLATQVSLLEDACYLLLSVLRIVAYVRRCLNFTLRFTDRCLREKVPDLLLSVLRIVAYVRRSSSLRLTDHCLRGKVHTM